MNENRNELSLVLASRFCHALTAALTKVCNVSWQCAGIDEIDETAPELSSGEHYRLSFGAPLEGYCLISVQSSEEWEGLKEKESSSEKAGNDTRPIAMALQASLEGLKASLSVSHREMMISIAKADIAERPTVDFVAIGTVIHSADAQLSVRLTFDAVLAQSLRQPASQTLFSGSLVGPAPQANLDLVMDVALSVTLRFGRRQLPLREIIDLTSGSVVELDRQVDEPVELVLDGRVIARGEAVVIDGNYGMRVTQIVQPLLNI